LIFYILRKTLKNKIAKRHANFKFIYNENIAPFSFLILLFTPSLYSPIELENILEHEKCTASNIILRRFIFDILYSFLVQSNSMVYKKAMIQNLEFIADKEALKI
jgi:hypothetical protein